ncbi:ABC transporter substrate-binding protein [Thermus islandicus]|uniref:ABC transporter substrate-binding protein n=1 Tax=Thermus islandicus TaxID=540988 RepID=UPI000426A22C|nr:ABC transporter substrate-binding protein [Thermus islandicus]
MRWTIHKALVLGLLALVPALAQDRTQVLVYGGDLTDLITLDPQLVYEFSGVMIADNLYETLVRFEGNDLSTLRPGLAESWSVERGKDAWVLTFKLRRGSRFSTGREVTAKDVVYSFERALALKGPGSFLFTEIAQLRPGATKALDPYTVEVRLPKTASPQSFLSILTFTLGGVVDSEEVQKNAKSGDYGKDFLANASAGSGPYRLVRWDRGSQVLLEANPYARVKPKLPRVVLRYIQEPAVLRTALESGEVDIAEGLTPEALRALANNPRFKVIRAETLRLQYLGMNMKAGSPFANPKVREAVRWAVNQDELIEALLQGNALKIQTFIPKGLLGYNPATPYRYDPARAKRLLAEAGYPQGLEFELLASTGICGGGVPCSDVAAKLQADMAKAGLRAKIRTIANAELLNTYRAQNHQMVLAGWSPDFPDPDGNATPWADYGARSLAWRNSYVDETAAKLARQAALEPDVAKRKALYKVLTEKVLRDGPYVVLYQPTQPIALSAKVEGFLKNPMMSSPFWQVSKVP